MGRKRARKSAGVGKAVIDPSDRLSSLPDDILQKILALVPTKTATQTAVLSRRWEGLWASVPSFEAESFHQYRKSFVNKFMDHYFLGRQASKDALGKFSLVMGYHGGKSRVDTWLDAAISLDLKHLKLNMVGDILNKNLYQFPHSFLLRLNGLKSLNLEGMEWPTNYHLNSLHFASLKALSLVKVFGLHDHMLSALLSQCPSLQDMLLKNCVHLKTPKIRSSTLKWVTMLPNNTVSVLVHAENLEALVFDRGHTNTPCALDLVACFALKHVSFSNATFADRVFEGLLARLPSLETLELHGCHNLTDFKLESQTVLTLVLSDFRQCLHKKATIVTPNLQFLSFKDESLIGLVIAHSPKLVEAHIYISSDYWYSRTYTREWYVNLINFLSQLDYCKHMTMRIAVEKALIIPESMKREFNSPLANLKLLKLRTRSPLFRKRMFKASLDWISPSLETMIFEESKSYI